MKVWVAYISALNTARTIGEMYPGVWQHRSWLLSQGVANGVESLLYKFDDSLREQVLATDVPWLTILGVEE